MIIIFMSYFFFFKQKTAYEMRISDWSSDVCSSDLARSAGSSGNCCRQTTEDRQSDQDAQSGPSSQGRQGKEGKAQGRTVRLTVMAGGDRAISATVAGGRPARLPPPSSVTNGMRQRKRHLSGNGEIGRAHV